MRLTPELIRDSLSYLNTLKERELDLRGHRIPAIENLGVAGPHDAIDLTDNDIQVLGNLPLSPRITTLLLARNHVSAIQPSLANSVPSLTNLALSSNNIAELADLDPLGKLGRLTHLVLEDNPVTKKENYRYWVIWKCPSVRFLDYSKVKEAERKRGEELFGTAEEPTALATEIMNKKSKGASVTTNGSSAQAPSKLSRIKLTDSEKKKLQERIRNATSLQEIIALEKELNEGRLPTGIHGDSEDVAMQE
ncbi:U2 small nuclear ribonucleoprotein A' [Geosmithia morbida]|uniref:U2 small nuclear ribonucleoprotein A' n=1 Tax=Geosmithia morbida TaxID=1094350 RepID=A0A9P5D3R4_9HYPO|nr:U2 small nuclear ribonucleoprotein A' [Geosmithia morbida]KAF4125237.1 U2 small nuclear ribonucleoprotein A' [Geosmithia morbida]